MSVYTAFTVDHAGLRPILLNFREIRMLPSLRATFLGSCLVLWCSLVSAARDEVADTRFKYKRGFYDSPFAVVIQSRTEGARIRYTIDGSAPSPTHGLGGTNPVVVPIETTTTLRAIAYRDGLEPSNVDTHTYIFPRHVLKQPRYPEGFPTSIGKIGMGDLIDFDYEMDPEIVNHPDYRREIVSALKSIPTLSIVMNKDDLFGQVLRSSGELDRSRSGVYFGHQSEGTIHPASVELIDPEHADRGFQIDCGLESHAGYGVKRALKLRFQKEYGPGKLESSFLRYAPVNGDSATTQFDRLVLRSGHTRSFAGRNARQTTYARDQWVRDTQIAMSGIGSHGTFVHLYLDGFYWGLYNVVERPDAWFTSTYIGGEKSDWLGVNHNGVMHGDATRWTYLRGELKDKNMAELANYRELQEYLDVARFADYIILGWYSRLDDWGPDRNWYGGTRNNPPGRFQFYMWDSEYSLFAGAEPMAWVNRLFRTDRVVATGDMVGIWHSLARSAEFMTIFADRVYQHCFHGALTEESSIARWRRLNAFIESAVIAESARWGDSRKVLGEPTRTRNDTFRPQVEAVVGMMTGNVPHFIEVLRRESYYPGIDPPELQRASAGSITLVHDGGAEIYYTLDGSDPRLPGGAVSSSAQSAQSGDDVSLEEAATLKARSWDGAQWSALNTTEFP